MEIKLQTGCYGQINVFMVADVNTIPVVGGNITLICAYSPKAPNPRIFWKDGNNSILASLDCENGICQNNVTNPTKFNTTFDGDGSVSLAIQNLAVHDSGKYKCSVTTNRGKRLSSLWVAVLEQVRPNEVSIEGDLVRNLTANETTDVTCIAKGARPPAALQWIIPESVQVSFTRQTNVKKGNFYTSFRKESLSPSRDAHGVRLICKVSHPQLQEPIETSVLLNVQAPPTSVDISIPSRPIRDDGIGVYDIIIFKDNLTNITCTSNGSRPAANISWTLNANEISNDVTSHFTYNPVDETSDSPEIHLPNKLIEGNVTSVTCSTGNGYPLPLIRWYIGSRNITNQSWPNQTHSDHGRADITSTLEFTPAKSDNGRNLTCEIIQMMAFTVPPRLYQKAQKTLEILYPPVIHELTFRQLVNDVTFTCRSDASPPASQFTWFRNGKSLDASNGHQQQRTDHHEGNTTSSSKLTIQNVTTSDQGKYMCKVSTNLGRGSSAINYTFASTPQAPSNLIVQQKQTTSSTIIVAWQPGFYGGFQQTYTLQYCTYEKEDPGQKVCYHKADINSTTYTIRNLKPYTRYEIILWSANRAGNSSQRKIVSSTARKIIHFFH
ncbi:neural cell adhesion molecule 1-like [Lytechinus variegatus]|uniref:neural cell adhesion molecule 1-like n=1 Tax=Lytechinus variegatus TaxID=7654 RepID=UPI001BB0F808|nr:neural cell adhesion molecule 1-like [Lytechinus variegatus]